MQSRHNHHVVGAGADDEVLALRLKGMSFRLERKAGGEFDTTIKTEHMQACDLQNQSRSTPAHHLVTVKCRDTRILIQLSLSQPQKMTVSIEGQRCHLNSWIVPVLVYWWELLELNVILCWELRNIYHLDHHPESKKRKSSQENSGFIHPYGRYGNAAKTRKTISTIAILWPVKAIFEKRAATVEVDSFLSPALWENNDNNCFLNELREEVLRHHKPDNLPVWWPKQIP